MKKIIVCLILVTCFAFSACSLPFFNTDNSVENGGAGEQSSLASNVQGGNNSNGQGGNKRPGAGGGLASDTQAAGNGGDVGLRPDGTGAVSSSSTHTGGNGEDIGLIPDGTDIVSGTDSSTDDGLVKDPEIDMPSMPGDEFKILYVDSSLKLKDDGTVDMSYTTMLCGGIRASGYTVNNSDMYKSTEDVPEEKLQGYDLYIFVSVSEPAIVPTDGAIWYINTEPTSLGITFKGEMVNENEPYLIEEKDENATDWASYIIKHRVDVNKSMIFTDSDGEEKTIYCQTGKYKELTGNVGVLTTIYQTQYYSPLVMAGAVNNQAVILFTFDIKNSSLPFFLVDFPTLIMNMIRFSATPTQN